MKIVFILLISIIHATQYIKPSIANNICTHKQEFGNNEKIVSKCKVILFNGDYCKYNPECQFSGKLPFTID